MMVFIKSYRVLDKINCIDALVLIFSRRVVKKNWGEKGLCQDKSIGSVRVQIMAVKRLKTRYVSLRS